MGANFFQEEGKNGSNIIVPLKMILFAPPTGWVQGGRGRKMCLSNTKVRRSPHLTEKPEKQKNPRKMALFLDTSIFF